MSSKLSKEQSNNILNDDGNDFLNESEEDDVLENNKPSDNPPIDLPLVNKPGLKKRTKIIIGAVVAFITLASVAFAWF